MQFIRIAKTSDFKAPGVRSYRIMGRYIGVFLEPDGSFRAMEVACKHQNADLTGGRMDGDKVTCPWHGWRYNLRTGECLRGSGAPLRPHALEVRGEDIYVSLRPVSHEEQPDQQLDFDDGMGQ